MKITNYNYIASAIGNAKFSDVSFDVVWNAIAICNNSEQLDAVLAASIKLTEIVNETNNRTAC